MLSEWVAFALRFWSKTFIQPIQWSAELNLQTAVVVHRRTPGFTVVGVISRNPLSN